MYLAHNIDSEKLKKFLGFKFEFLHVFFFDHRSLFGPWEVGFDAAVGSVRFHSVPEVSTGFVVSKII